MNELNLKNNLIESFDQLILEMRNSSTVDMENYSLILKMLDDLAKVLESNDFIDKEIAMLFIDFFLMSNFSKEIYKQEVIDDFYYKVEEIYSKVQSILVN